MVGEYLALVATFTAHVDHLTCVGNTGTITEYSFQTRITPLAWGIHPLISLKLLLGITTCVGKIHPRPFWLAQYK